MKTLLNCILALALVASNLIAGGSTSAPVRVYESNVDSVNTARAFIARPASYYDFWVDIYIDTADKKQPDHQMTGVMLPDGKIASLKVNGEIILTEDDAPLLSLPLPKDGVISFIGVYMRGHAESGEDISWGSGYGYDFQRGNALVVTVYPSEMQGFISFVVPNGDSINNYEIVLANGWWAYYDDLFKGFVVRIDPTRIWTEYYVRDRRNGAVIARGVLLPFEKSNSVPNPASSSSFAVVYANGVVDGALKDRGYNAFDGQELDGQTVDDAGVASPAKVYFTEINQGDNLHVGIWGVEGKVEVYGVTESGKMPLLHAANSFPNEFNGVHQIRIEDLSLGGFTKLIIKVTGKVVVKKGFTTYLSDRFRG